MVLTFRKASCVARIRVLDMLDRQAVVEYLKSLSQDEIAGLLLAASVIPNGGCTEQAAAERIPCPHCGSHDIILYGSKHGKQRYFCKECGKTYVSTTGTVLSMSHFGMDVWQEFLRQTLEGCSLSYAEKTLGLTHQTAFNMRHKLLMAFEDFFVESPVVLGDVSEFDETFVLDSYKGKTIPETADRPSRRHGAKAQKRGISNEYVCICTGVQRKGEAVIRTENRAKPSREELQTIFEGHIQSGTLALTDGLRSYPVLGTLADCKVEDVNGQKSGFYNLNTVNNLHSFIKSRYLFYRGVATKYLNRYNALFQMAYRSIESKITLLIEKLFKPGCTMNIHTVKDVATHNLLVV